MNINLYADPDGKPVATNVPLQEAFPDEHERAVARNALETQGQYWTGAPHIVFVAVAS